MGYLVVSNKGSRIKTLILAAITGSRYTTFVHL
jgi:hypothetical protein